jgi:D-amino-acid dehydrogenase
LASPGVVRMGLRMMRDPRSSFYVKPRMSWDLLSWGWRFWRCANQQNVRRAAPLLRDLNMASRACYQDLAAMSGNEIELQNDGLLMLCKSEKTLEHEGRAAQLAGRLGLPVQVLDVKATVAREPDVQMDIAGSVFYPLDGHLTPKRTMSYLQRHLEQAGVKLMWSTQIERWRKSGHRIHAAIASSGEVTADEFVLCAGAWSSGIARELGLKLPMQAGKGYSLTLTHPPILPRTAAILTEARVAVTPMGRALRFAGTMEIAGMDLTINPLRVAGIVESIPRYYPQFGASDFENVSPWCGLRPCSPDGLPYLGRTRAYQNVCIATGHAMMGLSLGPISGKLIAETVSGETPSIDIHLLDPDRFA